MLNPNKATAAQARFICALAEKVDRGSVEMLCDQAASWTHCQTFRYNSDDTLTRFVRRIQKKAASVMIDELKRLAW